MNAIEAINKRKSIRNYEDRPIPEELLLEILRAGQNAPQASGVHFSIVTDKAVLKELNDTIKKNMIAGGGFGLSRASLPGYEPFYATPAVFFLSDKAGGTPAAQLAAENIIVAAVSLGLGTVYLGSPTATFRGEGGEKYAQMVGIPEGYKFVCGVAMGYPLDNGEKFSTGAVRSYDNYNFVK